MVELCRATGAEIAVLTCTLQLCMTQARVTAGARLSRTSSHSAAESSQEHRNGQGTVDDQQWHKY